MRRSITFLSAIIVAGASLAMAGDATTYGDGVNLDEAVAIETLMAEPAKYAGKTVRVDGVVTGVCKNRGCWIHITDPDTGRGIRVKVEDGVIVFPHSAMGHKASAEGVFEAIKLTPEQAAKMKAEHAAEGKKGCAKAEAAKAAGKEGCAKAAAAKAEGKEGCAKAAAEKKPEAGCSPEVHGDSIYLLRGTGAVISA